MRPSAPARAIEASGLVDALVVGAVREPEVRAAVQHVDVDRCPGREEVVEFAGGCRGIRRVVMRAPVVEPTAPELRAHQGAGGLLAAQRREALGRARAERAGREEAGDVAGGEHRRLGLVDGRQRHGGAGLAEQVGERLQVGVVGSVRAVLVLDLQQDDRTAAVDLQRRDDVHDGAQVVGDRRHVARFERADADLGVAEEPCRESAAVELGADVGAGAHDRVQALFLHLAQETGEVEPPGRVEHARLGAVLVPGDVGLDRVEAHHAPHADAVAPLVGVDAEVMQGSGDHPVRLAVQKEVVLTDRERVPAHAHHVIVNIRGSAG